MCIMRRCCCGLGIRGRVSEKGCVMNGASCGCDLLYVVRFDAMRDDLRDLSSRVGRLETVLTRGLLLLVANLLGVVGTLVSGIL